MMTLNGKGGGFGNNGGDGCGDGRVHGNTSGGSNAFLSTPLNSWGTGSGKGFGDLEGSGFGDGRAREAQQAAVRLLMRHSEMGFYMCQLHTLGGWR